MSIMSLPGGAQAALTTTEAAVNLTALAGRSVLLWCDDGDIWISGDSDGLGTLVTAGASAASTSSLKADRIAQGYKVPRRVSGHQPYLIAKMVTGTGTLHVKVVSDVDGGEADAEVSSAPPAGSVEVDLGENPLAVTDNDGSLTVDTPQLPAALGGQLAADSLSVTFATDTVGFPVTAGQLPAALGQTDKDGSLSVTVASDQGALSVSDGGGSLTVDDGGESLTVDGTVTVEDGGASLTVDSPQLPAALGQTTMENSLAVTLASNQTAVPVADGGGSLTVDGAVTVSGTVTASDGGGSLTVDDGGSSLTVDVSGTVAVTDNSGSLTVDSPQLPAALGQTTKANSLAVTLASNQDALPVTDNSGSLTVDSAQLPSSLGAAAAASSLSVVKATATVTDNATYWSNVSMGADATGADITVGPEGKVSGYFSWPSTSAPIGRIVFELRAPDGSTFKEVPGSAAAFLEQPVAGAAGSTHALFEGLTPGRVVRFKYFRTSGGTTNSLQGQTSVS